MTHHKLADSRIKLFQRAHLRLRVAGATWFLLIWLALAVTLLTIPHLPLTYSFDVGHEEGYGSDLPHVQGFNTAERDDSGTYRWTSDVSTIRVPGLGQRTVIVELDFVAVSDQVLAVGPQAIAVWSGAEQLAVLPVQVTGPTYAVQVPARLLSGGNLELTLRSTTFAPPGDPRRLGTPLDAVTVRAAGSAIPTAPAWYTVGSWLLTLGFAWATLQITIGHDHRRAGTLLLAIGALLIAIAAWLDPPRWAFGARPALIATALSLVLALSLRRLLPALASRLNVPLSGRTLGWLVLIIVVAFGMRYGGRIYPDAMHGDIGFHVNRYNDTVKGLIFIVSDNRGIAFPYPPGPYLLIAPFTLPGLPTATVLEFGAALIDGVSALLIYLIVAGIAARAGLTATARRSAYVTRIGLIAAAIYVFSAAGFMTTWWSFDTHIYTQFTTLLFITALALSWGLQYKVAYPLAPAWLLGVLLSLVFLGHFGFFINTALLLSLLLAVLWLAARRGDAFARAFQRPLLLAFIGAGVFAAVFFYSAYIPIFLSQARIAAEGGLSAVAERAPVTRAYLWRVLWQNGLIVHFGFFPLVLAIVGVWTLGAWPVRRRQPVALLPATRWLTAVMLGCYAVSVLFAAIPFLTLATNSTRWLMFSAWAIAICAALAGWRLWQSGRAGKLTVVAMTGFALWNTTLIWLGPMLWRIRPPEPF